MNGNTSLAEAKLKLELTEFARAIGSAGVLGVGATTALIGKYYLGLPNADIAKLTATTMISSAAIPILFIGKGISFEWWEGGIDNFELDLTEFAAASGLTYLATKVIDFDVPVGPEVMVVAGLASVAGNALGHFVKAKIDPYHAPGPVITKPPPMLLPSGANNMPPPAIGSPILLPGGTNNTNPRYGPGPVLQKGGQYAPGPILHKGGTAYAPGPWITGK